MYRVSHGLNGHTGSIYIHTNTHMYTHHVHNKHGVVMSEITLVMRN
jgi:hypothetical protein